MYSEQPSWSSRALRASGGAILLAALAASPMTALAECDKSEQLRLGDEMKKLASRNAWSGVERSYTALLETKCELNFEQYFLGAESARYLGKTWEQFQRLEAASKIDAQEDITLAMQGLNNNYGRIEIKGDPRRRPELQRPQMPFQPDQRKSVEWAQTVMANTGSFKGMLPTGVYVVGDIQFEVDTGDVFQEIVVGKQRGGGGGGGKSDGGGKEGGGGSSTSKESFVNYSGPIAVLGAGLYSSGAPECLLASGDNCGGATGFENPTAYSPGDISATSMMIQVGYELGLTYREPVSGIAVALGYNPTFGNHNLHQMRASLQAVIRPGQLRIAVGPSYHITTGKGLGVSDWFDVGQSQVQYKTDNIDYKGTSFGPGGELSVGYGLLDLDPFRGVVELGSSFMVDDTRTYLSVGLRVGIVPNVPRFDG